MKRNDLLFLVFLLIAVPTVCLSIYYRVAHLNWGTKYWWFFALAILAMYSLTFFKEPEEKEKSADQSHEDKYSDKRK